MAILSHDKLLTLWEACVTTGLANSRSALLVGIPIEVVASLAQAATPREQILLDLDALNQIADYALPYSPLRIWLANAAALARNADETGIFAQALQALGERPLVPESQADRTLQVYLCYARADEALCDELRIHLASLHRSGAIAYSESGGVAPGADWQAYEAQRAGSADIILILVSSDFLASSHLFDVVLPRILQRREQGAAAVIPILVRACDYSHTPFSSLDPLPRNRSPIAAWSSRDEAWAEVVSAVRLVIRDHVTHGASQHDNREPTQLRTAPSVTHRLHEVFRKSGVPTVTFVPHHEFLNIRFALVDSGRGLVIEGPSGVGKTTAIRRAADIIAEESSSAPSVHILSARNSEDVRRIAGLRTEHSGTVVIDDFHRLPNDIAASVVDYLKDLADEHFSDRKLVLVGIPRTADSLVRMSYDVATRIDVFRLGSVNDETVLEMVRLGEDALNIEFDRKTEIMLAASGSLNIAQHICYQICAQHNVPRTLPTLTKLRCDLETAVDRARIDLARKFWEPVCCLAAFGGRNSRATLRLLEELSKSVDGSVILKDVQRLAPELARELDQLADGHWVVSAAQTPFFSAPNESPRYGA